MTATAAARKALPARSGQTKPRPRLIVLTSPQSAGRTPFVVVVATLFLTGLLALLMLHMFAAQDAFRQTSLQQKLSQLTDTEQHLQQQVQLDSAPAALRARAKALGMVPSTVVGYHRLADGRVVAHEVAANSAAATAAAASSASTTTETSTATKDDAATSDAATSSDNARSDNAPSDKARSDNAPSDKARSDNAGKHEGATRR